MIMEMAYLGRSRQKNDECGMILEIAYLSRLSKNQPAPNGSENSVSRADHQKFNTRGTIFKMGYLGCD